MIHYKTEKQLDSKQLLQLYQDVGWSAYTENPDKLVQALQKSQAVISAWNEKVLIGLIRAVGDGETILYIQDILVKKSAQSSGIGSSLMKKMLAQYPDVRQKVLLTNDAPDVRHFYEKFAFSSCDHGDTVAFYREY